jgi:predicted NBD/HSP70 family sugar kinase
MRNTAAVQSTLLGAAILNVRSDQATSRTTLSKRMNLSPSTVGLYVDQLLKDGWIVETGLDKGAKGRPKRHLQVKSDSGWFAGVEFTVDRVMAKGVDFAGREFTSATVPLPSEVHSEDVLAAIDDALETIRAQANHRLLAIGLGVPGIVDPVSGMALRFSFVPDWQNVPIAQHVQKRLPVPVFLENSLRAVAIGERWFGDGMRDDDYVILGPRSGFGVAIVKNGAIIRGAHHAAGEIGLWDWPFGGHQGDMHSALSAKAVWRRLNGLSMDSRLPTDLYQAFSEWKIEPSQQANWDSIVDQIARIVGYLQLVLDANKYFLHGPLRGLGETFCSEVSQRAIHLMPGLETRPASIVPTSLGDEAGALGAASLAMEAWEPPLENRPANS